MSVDVLMEIDPDKGQMWIRLYEPDAEMLRGTLVPGSRVAIYGTVSVYEASGGYPNDASPEAVGANLDAGLDPGNVVRKDRFQLNAGSLGLVFIASPGEAHDEG